MRAAVVFLCVWISGCSYPSGTDATKEQGAETRNSPARDLVFDTSDGGSAVTPLNFGLAVNKGSSLKRTWYTLNDKSCPVALEGAGVATRYESEEYSGSYKYRMRGLVRVKQPVHAMELIFVLFDLWGRQMTSMKYVHVADLNAGEVLNLEETGGGRTATESDVAEFLSSVTFVSQVRDDHGSFWRYDPNAVEQKILSISLHLGEDALADPESR